MQCFIGHASRGPKNPQSKCYDAVGYHPCRVANAGQRWHFDMLTKSCLRSQTCAEDRNNFHSREDCEYACPAYSFCLFPKVDQHCSNTTAQSQWFFDAKTHRCKKSANCVIGANAFVTRSECVSMCRAVDVCDAPRPLELCDSGQRTVWYYDPTSGQCLKDVNCHNRGNNFPSLQECRRVCVRRVSPVPMPSPVCYSFPPTHGCGRLMERWVYNLDAKRCERRFVCPKAGNSFVKRSTCEKTCPSDQPRTLLVPTTRRQSIRGTTTDTPGNAAWVLAVTLRGQTPFPQGSCAVKCAGAEMCAANTPLPHSCSEKERSVYSYNQDTKLCEKRSGCHNRGNNFPSMPECRKVCERRRSPEDCRHWPNRGPCYAFAFKWYYDHYHKNCFQFLYGGCNGGPNLFDSKEECLEVCFPHKRIPRGC
ncbi:hypothetical protein V5799_021123 [Amblyomma americanum]|uniref:BPTI/Kunitz inhibitor domain-containing protein n=1 Tax=Amblyomma americanum TaxID=6943 RepID=A0AAQ4FRD6_AMBAM